MLCVIVFSITPGCSWNADTARRVASITSWSSTGVQVRRRPYNRLERPMGWWSRVTGYGGIQPADRSLLYLRTYALEPVYHNDPVAVIRQLREQTLVDPDLESLHTLADLAYIQGHQSRVVGNQRFAGQMLATSVAASYQYLFDPRLDEARNIYDPVFREVCDIYNQSLEGLLRMMRDQDALKPGGSFTASTLAGRPLQVTIGVHGRWRNEEFESFEFVTDYNTEGLRNVHQTYGLGVPLIAIRQSNDQTRRPDERYYPADLSLPLTAFVQTAFQTETMAAQDSFEIELIDPLEKTNVLVQDRSAPLESDITTPLAYYLDDPLLDATWFGTAALLNGEFARQFGGLYMLEPFDAAKIPVVMVHGFWSSPVTWTEMFNDLRADKTLRDNYQFWFYLYPSGQPFWVSARQMREDLQQVQQTLDPQQTSLALQEMVLVGHSMGGLVSRLQTIDSGQRFWDLVSDREFSELKGNPQTRSRIRETLFFQANPSISRVITLGTPHQGSSVANSFTRWASEKLFTLPENFMGDNAQLARENPGFFKSDLLKIATSTDSLSPGSRFFEAMMQAETDPRVRFHNVVGVHESRGLSSWLGNSTAASDGVVSVASARCPNPTSEIEIESEHSSIHQKPRAILEVRRILNEHIHEVFGIAAEYNADQGATIQPVNYEADARDPRIPQPPSPKKAQHDSD